MAYLVIPSKRTRQPQGAVRVNWSNPLTFGLRGAWMVSGTNMLGNAVRGSGVGDLNATGSPTIVATPYGLGYSFNGSSQFLSNTENSAVTDVPCTFFIFCYQRGSNGRPLTISTGTTADDVIGFQLTGTDTIVAQHYDGSVNAVTQATITQSTWYSFAARFASNDNTAIFVNGDFIDASNASLSPPSNINRVTLGYAPWSNSEYLDGVLALPLMWNRALSDAEIAEVSRNAWQLFAPDPHRLYFAPSGGGATIYESTFADSWSLSDTYSASANLVSTYADNPTVIDSSSSSAVFSSAFAETIPVSDGPSADMGGTANRTQEESFTITDAYSANLTAVATISETLLTEDSLSASAIFNATFAETLPIVDGEEADAGRISDIAENVTVTDAYTAGIVAQATQAESVTTSDTYDTIAIYNPTLEETLPITDAVGATLTVPTSGTVDLSQESIDALALEIMNQLTSVPVRRL